MKKRLSTTVMIIAGMCVVLLFILVPYSTVYASDAAGNVAGAVQNTWDTAKEQIKTVVNNVVFPVIDVVLAVFFFVKVATSYFDYRKTGQFEFTAPAILFACLVFSLTAPLYVWTILGM